MKKKMNKIMLGVSTMALSLGALQAEVSAEEKVPYNVLQMKPAGIETPKKAISHSSKVDKTLSPEEHVKVEDSSKKPASAKENAEVNQSQQSYTLDELNKMSDEELIDTLANIKSGQIKGLFQFNEETKAFYKNKERLQVIMNGLEKRGSTFTKNDAKGIDTFTEVLRSAFYVGADNEELSYLKERSFMDKCLPALKAIAKNPNFKLGTAEQDLVVNAYGDLMRNASSDVETVQYAAKILKQYNNNLSTYGSDREKGNAVHTLLGAVDNDIQTYWHTSGKEPNETMWYGKIDSYINEVNKMALIGNVTDKTGWLINDGIYYAGRLGKFHSDSKKELNVVTKAMQMYPYLGEQYFWAAEQITRNYGGVDANGKTVNLDQIKEDGKKKFLPKTYTFDDGAIVFKAGDKVTEEKIQRMYWAAKEVKAQYHRVIGNDKALEQGNADDVLTVVIYNTPDEYKFNQQLYGYDTGNGGIYIENVGTFFTYERTPKESIYSLEELFRHEFTHYLQGRYEVPGLWGQGDFYKDERLTWFEEGNAEFFAGSTRTNNVVPRKSVIGNLSNEPAKRNTAEQALFSKYGSWDFYNYTFALQSYMYNHKFDTFDKIQDLIRANDVQGYDAYREELSKDAQLNKEYQTYMQQLIDNQEKFNVPQASDDYLVSHAQKALAEVKQEIADVANVKDARITKHKSQFFNTFTVEGTYTGGTTKGESEDWKTMNKQANEALEKLSQKGWSGYKTLTAHFVNYRVNNGNQFQYDIVFHGIATDEGANQGMIVRRKETYHGEVNSAIQFKSDSSKAEDRKIVSYLWDFGDGNTSTEENPTHAYEKEGTYTATVIMKDDKGKESKEQMTVTVERARETYYGEENNAIQFKSDSSKAEDRKIVSYLWDFGDGNTSTEENPTHAYEKEGTYTATVTMKDDKGKESKEQMTVTVDRIGETEKEPNNDPERANVIPLNTLLKGSFKDEDYKDTYTFNVSSPKEMNISVINECKINMTWVLFHESDMKKYVAGGGSNENILKGKFTAKPGKYYLYVYTPGESGTYSVKVK
ncbi:collagenase [Bacillus pseudomycoides]|uniref:collagenase n=2 Tax=Bacillus pseudomycoides TaxID=64104 RepID=UPI000BECA41E|nr:collagenase [Bacillus pseudomycoides]PED05103.1 collagenase [Bacillus pseudomycoides]PEI86487.1 collagenase [Bacillus pseudomycoides]PEK11673.1 collagenase [Bacillus pseudomycoides]PEM61927.1 collagenase [Bacillus pseudomycoides]PEP60035.1 collagenase [Bacillus pseudomycoides]